MNRCRKAYDWLQTTSAYPNGPLPTPKCHVDAARKWLKPLGRLLVLGPGTHAEASYLCNGTEQHVELLTLTASELDGLRAGGLSVTLGDAHDMPFKDASFDTIFSSNVMEHFFSPYGALMECRRVLREGGQFYAVVPTFDAPGGGRTPWHVYCFAPEQWRELMSKCGLNVEILQKTVEPAVGPGESYWHIRAKAVQPPPPHDEVLRRISNAS